MSDSGLEYTDLSGSPARSSRSVSTGASAASGDSAVAASPASAGTSAPAAPSRTAAHSADEYSFTDRDDDDAVDDIQPTQPLAGEERARPSATHSIISPDKTTMDILSANFIKECTQTVLNSNALGSKQKALLNEAIRGTQEVADGTAASGKVKQLWKEAARILPGVDSRTDFKSLIKVSRGTYDKALNHFFGKAGSQPKLENIHSPAKTGNNEPAN
jgi:hypothetical protein